MMSLVRLAGQVGQQPSGQGEHDAEPTSQFSTADDSGARRSAATVLTVS